MPGKTANGSRIPENVPKNRYKNDISCEFTVVLTGLFSLASLRFAFLNVVHGGGGGDGCGV